MSVDGHRRSPAIVRGYNRGRKPANAGTPVGPAEVLQEEDIRALLGTFSRRASTGIRDRALVLLLWRAGLRITEALSLDVGDLRLDAERPTLTVRKGKFGKQRVVGIHPEAVEALARWLDVRARLDLGRRRPVFCTLQGARVQDSQVRHMLSARARRAGLTRRVHPHAFRATLAVELAREGVPLPAIRDVLGHGNVAATDAYLRRVFPQDAVAAVIERTAEVLAEPAPARALAEPTPNLREQLLDALASLDDAGVERLLAAVQAAGPTPAPNGALTPDPPRRGRRSSNGH